ncbi:hypothetical protein NQ318_007713 [Aromia moschata]|uniref:DUF4817 domain-containing protein n=1 Tax=Aromia moschata TaxID=1265417 RepID=A0AAV8X6K2_9CUCU|nr:hypothetical protein NQ318_007713 [Aromia moschata]
MRYQTKFVRETNVFSPNCWETPRCVSNRVLLDMHFNGCANGNAFQAQRKNAEQYPERRLPHHTTFTDIHQRLREFGKFEKRGHDSGRTPEVRTEALEEDVLNLIEESPENFKRLKSLSSSTGAGITDSRFFTACGCETIRNSPGIFQNIRNCMRNRVDACIRAERNHFQHFL